MQNVFNLFNKKFDYISFEDLQNIIDNNSYILINTLPSNKQECLIYNTISSYSEEQTINGFINNYNYYNNTFIIYGMNCNDNTVENKFSQIKSLGFKKVFIYKGGLFEWLLLQDIYGEKNFKTTSKILDILKYKPTKIL